MKTDWPILGAVGAACLAMAGAAGYLMSGGAHGALASAIGLGGGCIGGLALTTLSVLQSRELDRRLLQGKRGVAQFQNELTGLSRRVFARLDQIDRENKVQNRSVLGGLSEMKSAWAELEQRFAPLARTVSAPEPEPAPRQEMSAADVGDRPAQPGLAGQLHYALEPVVDIPASRTAHYRLHATMQVAGTEMTGQNLLAHASAAGMRAMLDQLSVNEALGLLGRLRLRDTQLCILVPLGAETLREQAAVEKIIAACAAPGSMAGGLVLELSHVALAGLSASAIEGLAALSRGGLAFSLSNASIHGLDLPAMKTLNVKFVSLSAAGLPADGPSQSQIGFAQMARLSRISVIVTDLSNEGFVPKISALARLACGPCFAGPRRVKRLSDMVVTSTHDDIGLAA